MLKKLVLGVVAACTISATAVAQTGYSVYDAQYVAASENIHVLSYIVCLHDTVADFGTMQGNNIESSLSIAMNECRNMGNILSERPDLPDPSDLQASILECGFRAADASPDMGC